ncbi:DUF2194 domain-containing protein [Parasphingopyxis sp.]|uniref:DUF2194 domain-containing protein n=1 Tax=Parasphingopyxis sp. TaxID=1920299 RepID=UPI00260CF590|nr:DUF2194 domain-containing protein [Parasphingopyxis sp.]
MRENAPKAQRILFVQNGQDEAAAELAANAAKALDEARLDHERVDISDALHLPSLEHFSSVLLCVTKLEELGLQGITDLADYAAEGGGVVFPHRIWHRRLHDLAGFEERPTPPRFAATEPTTEGLRITGAVLPLFDGVELDREQLAGHRPLDLTPRDNVEIFAVSEEDYPLAWLHRLGNGRVIYWNSKMLEQKRLRGLIVQSVLAVQPVAIWPIANVGVIQIDDFPAPLWHEDMGPVLDQYPDLNATQFYGDIWHPDMLDLADRYGLTYSYFTIFNYNDRTSSPFPFDEWTYQTTHIAGTEVPATPHAAAIASNAGELALHGYNHMSLLNEIWSSQAMMEQALGDAAGRWDADDLGPLPVSYVPPNNEYDRTGIAALSSALPSVASISGSYLHGEFERGGQREFGPEPWNEKLFCLPRATSGYEYSADMQFDALSQIGVAGIWTHFTHADDVFDMPPDGEEDPYCRNPKRRRWRGKVSTNGGNHGLLDEFERWIADFKRRFPWLRYATTRAACRLVEDHLRSDWAAFIGAEEIRVRSEPGSWFQIRLNTGAQLDPHAISGAELVSAAGDNGCLADTLRSTAPVSVLRFRKHGRVAKSSPLRGGLRNSAKTATSKTARL